MMKQKIKNWSLVFSLFPIFLGATGKDMVGDAEKSYKEGSYSAFLSGLHTEYEHAGKEGLLKRIYDKLKASTQKPLSSDEKQAIEAALNERRQRLEAICSETPDLEVCKRVQSAFLISLDSEDEQVLHEIEQLRYQIPEGKEVSLSGAIAALETQYRLKAALFEVAAERAGTDIETHYKKKVALGLEKLEKMQKVADRFKDSVWQEKLRQARVAYEAKIVRQIDYDYLRNLADGKIAAQNETEEKIKAILLDYMK